MKSNKGFWSIVVIAFLATCVAHPFLPDRIPMHYDIQGNIDRWGSKNENFIFPILLLLFSFFWQGMIYFFQKKASKSKSEKEKVEAENNIKVIRVAAVATNLLMLGIQIVATMAAYTEAIKGATVASVDFNMITGMMLGILLIVLGNYMPKAKRNTIVGFRTAKTLSDEEIWKKANHFAGITFMIAGLLIVVESACLGGAWSMILAVTISLLTTIVDLIYVAKL